MEPTYKSPAIESLLQQITGKNRRDTIMAGECTTCSATSITIASFRNLLSVKEYQISGMCQKC